MPVEPVRAPLLGTIHPFAVRSVFESLDDEFVLVRGEVLLCLLELASRVVCDHLAPECLCRCVLDHLSDFPVSSESVKHTERHIAPDSLVSIPPQDEEFPNVVSRRNFRNLLD